MRAYLIAATVSLSACSTLPAEAVGEYHQSVVVGSDDLVPVDEDGGNIPARYGAVLDAIGLVQPIGCTAVHIGGGLVLTAGHCVATGAGDCSGLQIEWGYRGSRMGGTSTCSSVVAFEHDANADYALLQVTPAPAAAVPVEACSEPAPGTAITVFSHPNRRPLEWSNVCMVEPGTEAGRGGLELAHACDTENGSSGAPILDDDTLHVVGIHDGGIAPWNYGTLVAPIPFFAAARAACSCAGAAGAGQGA